MQYVSTTTSDDYAIVATVQFLCVPDAVSPYLGSDVSYAALDAAYTAVVWTQQACGCPSYPSPANYTYGTTWTFYTRTVLQKPPGSHRHKKLAGKQIAVHAQHSTQIHTTSRWRHRCDRSMPIHSLALTCI